MKFFISFLLFFGLINCSAQTFSFSISTDTTYCSAQNSINHCYSYIGNDNPELLEIDVIRLEQLSLENWGSAMCADTVCYYAIIDSIRINIAPNSNIEFRPGFILINDTTSEVAHVTYLIQDANDSTSQLFFDTYAINSENITSNNNLYIDEQILVYPNPTSNQLIIETELGINSIQLINVDGRILSEWKDLNNINLIDFQDGIYLLKINTELGVTFQRIVKI